MGSICIFRQRSYACLNWYVIRKMQNLSLGAFDFLCKLLSIQKYVIVEKVEISKKKKMLRRLPLEFFGITLLKILVLVWHNFGFAIDKLLLYVRSISCYFWKRNTFCWSFSSFVCLFVSLASEDISTRKLLWRWCQITTYVLL